MSVAVARNLEDRIQQQIARRSKLAAVVYVVLFSLLTFSTSIGVVNPEIMITFGCLLSFFGCLRFFLPWNIKTQSLLRIVVFLNSLTWGVFCYYTLSIYQLSGTSFGLLLATAGISSGIVLSFTPSFQLLRTQIAATLLPVVLGFLQIGSIEAIVCAGLTGVYLMYLILQAKTVSEAYVRDLESQAVITVQKKELEVALKDAVSAAQIKSDFLSMMSHEIRTPLNGIIGMAQLMETDSKLSQQQQDEISTIRKSSQDLLVIVNDVLDFSKIESGKMELERKEFDIVECIGNSIKFFEATAQRKGLKLHLMVSPNISQMVYGDMTRFRQILLNLLSNAIKFTKHGEVTVSLRTEQKTLSKHQYYISVSDTGIGISETHFPKLFQMFSQLDGSTTREYGGTGLGLAICKKLCQLMDGDIQVKSELGKGSTFSFSLPFEISPAVVGEKTIPEKESPQVNRDVKRVRILVAEDNNINQTVIQKMLLKLGDFEVKICANGIEALEEVQKKHYDLILMDCQMPGMDGYEATQKIRKIEAINKIPIVAITANALEGDREKCLAAGMDDYLSKPLEMDELEQTIRKWLRCSNKTRLAS